MTNYSGRWLAWKTWILHEGMNRPDIVVIGVGSVSLARAFGEGPVADPLFEITNPAPALEALERGDFDVLALGRGLLGDPDWVVKVSSDPMWEGWRTLIPYSSALLDS
jgi:2,4-dienoyl-CoA reductase-like NADH-dependent reductase (Old Yellow Enzyme family)